MFSQTGTNVPLNMGYFCVSLKFQLRKKGLLGIIITPKLKVSRNVLAETNNKMGNSSKLGS